uniref:CSON008393 protein n=1 Tax=Culicoides sonorensis TaxID=179676 RepID=A0A336LG21_CULSO
MSKYTFVFLFALFGLILCEIYEFEECFKADDDEAPDHYNCNVTAVRISPCPDYPCKVKRGRKAVVELDFTPLVDVESVENDVYWASPEGDLEWQGLYKNACTNTECPLKNGVSQSYTYSVDIDKKVPTRSYDIKWGLKNGDQIKCCALIKIVIKK